MKILLNKEVFIKVESALINEENSFFSNTHKPGSVELYLNKLEIRNQKLNNKRGVVLAKIKELKTKNLPASKLPVAPATNILKVTIVSKEIYEA